jgi:hypothetical protein
MDNHIEVGQLTKNTKIVTKIRITEFKGNKYIDIRDYFLPANGQDYQPTKKGTAMPVALISDLVTLLEKAEQTIKGGTK